MNVVIARIRGGIVATAEPDPVTQDILNTVAADLEKQSWMWQARNGP
ncbi:hypothetical protein [Nocardia arthritidis]|uniref:Uncharacterized protein n=1 Tax=Nocardia arthritidis TaxID=228602 RepID=A0A6G9YLM6_9NOCA|nr:hypothetical protein [Nocardia arthritidis]QIS13977.1 hypothetical protein F5544_30670 [Nocardia arthritidis]